ncbi:uncharacterized protein L969DRAFT_15683 [Mixia osmundae IAM 14324]|uniref:Phosphatidylserine decarboxylase proenzyme 2 n=1 Tax=Mixia osmundae (strain CBS 9802 / IAM 14324 / JCM 22182 / KY 12970) TaxID=764103 RepID=G7DYV4_MIXOS|nr:uncharacterized protein L969DRAFT_15683 [Mixia osmundae IAM 14324]KEI41660.1 hypothetical protein L969DRAFT_15683 [Mixia osmundae IAM 14324]GAA95764.1 hypothetical protein E5Q_02421 [Mixia osmundae IAM 14324]
MTRTSNGHEVIGQAHDTLEQADGNVSVLAPSAQLQRPSGQTRRISSRLPFPQTRRKLARPFVHKRGGATRRTSADETEPIGTLCVSLLAARNLAAKDRNGTSDPFAVLRLGDVRAESSVVRKSLNPVWGDASACAALAHQTADGHTAQPAVLVTAVHADLANQQIEIVMWDKDRVKKDYLGEVSLSADQWFEQASTQGPAILYDDTDNHPKWHRLTSSRRAASITGDVLVKIGFIAADPRNGPVPREHPTAGSDAILDTSTRLSELSIANPVDQLRDTVQEAIRERQHLPQTRKDRILTAPPANSVGTQPIDDEERQLDPLAGSDSDSDVELDDVDQSDEEDASDDMETLSPDEDAVGSGKELEDDDYFRHVVGYPSQFASPSMVRTGSASTRSHSPEIALRQTDSPPVVEREKARLSIPNFIKRAGSSRSLHSTQAASTPGATTPGEGATTPGSRRRRLPGRRRKASDRDGSYASTSSIETSPVQPKVKARKRLRRRNTHGFHFETGGRDDIVGVVFVEIAHANDLPREKNALRTGFDCDPFVILSFGQKVFRTRVIRHSLNPAWNERLFFHVRRHELNFQLLASLYDWDRASSNDHIGDCSLALVDLLEHAPRPDEQTGLYATTPQGDLRGDHLNEYKLAVVKDGTDLKHVPSLTIRARFSPYAALRQQFWRTYLSHFDPSTSGKVSYVGLFSMLDSLGSTLSADTITSIFTHNGKESTDELSIDDVVRALELELVKPKAQKRRVEPESHDSGLATPALDTGVAHGISNFGGLEQIGHSAQSSGDKATASDGHTAPPNGLPAMLRGHQVSELPSIEADNVDDEQDQPFERVINITSCPLCQNPRLKKRAEVDIVTHLAVCASKDWQSLANLVVNNYVTADQAHRKWVTKVISAVSKGAYSLGANSANIIVQDRATGQLLEEKMQIYVRLSIRLMYKGMSNRLDGGRIRRMLRSMSFKQGQKFDDPSSVREIPNFVRFHNLDLSEVRDPIGSFKSFNEFFYRKLKPDARPICEPDNPNILVSGADCRLMAFESIEDSTKIWIKGRDFSIERLLGSTAIAKDYNSGSLIIMRLAPQDYHRYHSPVRGKIVDMKRMGTEYYSVNPMSVRSSVGIYTDNVRENVAIETEAFGRVYYICVGAMLVGSICQTRQVGDQLDKGDEVGYFKFGGSTILLLFKAGAVKFDEDLLLNSSHAIETLVRVGTRIGERR